MNLSLLVRSISHNANGTPTSSPKTTRFFISIFSIHTIRLFQLSSTQPSLLRVCRHNLSYLDFYLHAKGKGRDNTGPNYSNSNLNPLTYLPACQPAFPLASMVTSFRSLHYLYGALGFLLLQFIRDWHVSSGTTNAGFYCF